MQELINSYKNNKHLHHCYLVLGDIEEGYRQVSGFCEGELGVVTHGNPDFALIEAETLGVDEVRLLIERQSRRAANQGMKIFIIKSNFFTREAQHALLKVLEEPTMDTHFFILTTSTNGLLPTLLSRVSVVKTGSSSAITEAKEFMAASLNERLELAKKLATAGEKQKIIDLVRGMEEILYQKGVKANVQALFEMAQMSGYLYDRSTSSKMILEHLALTLPEAK